MMEIRENFVLWMYLLCIFIAATYAVPPRIVSAPTVSLANSEALSIQWTAWDENTDEGDGPVASYLAVARNASGDPNAEFLLTIDAGLNTFARVEPLMWETQYEIAVICVDGNGDRGDPSPLLTVTTPCGVPQEAPTLNSLETINTTALRLTWTAPPQSSWRCSSLDDIQVAYEYKRNTVPNFPTFSNHPRTPINDGELVIGGLDPCSTYDVGVNMYAATAQEFSDDISTINGTTEFEKVGPISSPGHVSQSNLGPNFILSWQPPSSGYCEPDNYTVTYAVTTLLACPDEEQTKVAEEVTDVTVTTYVLNDLEYYAEYEINITGVNPLGPGETVTYYASTVDGTPVSAPEVMYREDLAALGELNFNWTATPCEDIQGKFGRYLYEVYLLSDRISLGRTTAIDSRDVKVTGLLGCTEYRFRVRMTNAKGPGPFSDYVAATTPPEAPDHVKDLSSEVVASTPTSLNVSWAPSTEATPCLPESYHIEYTLSLTDQCEDANSTSPTALPLVAYPDTYVIIENLQPYSTYEVSIFALNEAGNSSRVFKMVSTGEQEPTGMPGDVTVTAVEYDSLSFSFSALLCGERLGQIVAYNYELRDASTGDITSGNTTDMMVTLSGLSRNTEYGFKVRAQNSAGSGPFSEEVLQNTALGLPTAPLDLKVSGNPSSPITLTWSPPSEPNGNILSYQMHFWNASEDVSDAMTVDITDFGDQLEVMISDLEPLTEYIFGVRATNEAGQGPWSNNVTEEIWEGAPSPVVDLMAAEISEDSLTIQWEAPLEPQGIISKYTVVYSVIDRPYTMDDDSETKVTETLPPTEMGFTLFDLEPATEYEITVTASTSREDGEPSTITQYTLVPDDIPPPTEAYLESASVSEDGTLKIKLPAIEYQYATAYQIAVHCVDADYDPVFFKGDNATDCSYVTGEVPKKDEDQIFIIGDGETYGKYLNKPLDPEKKYEVYVSIVSRTDAGSSSSWGSEPLEAPERKAGLIILWIFIVILLIVIILLTLWCAYSCLRKNKEEKKPPGTPEEQVPLE